MTVTTPGTEHSFGVPAAWLALMGWAASGVIAKGIDLGALAVVFWRMWIYAVAILVFLAVRRRPLSRRALWVALPGGVALGADLMFFFSAVKLTTVANATIIGAMQPVLMLALARPLFGEQPRAVDWSLSVVALGGVAVVVFGSAGLPESNLSGDLLAVATLLAWTGYFVFSKLTRDRIDAFEYTAATALVAAAVSTPFALVSGQLARFPDAATWAWLVILALGPGFVSHLLMNWALGHIPAWLGGTLTLAIPVTSTTLAWLFLGEEVLVVQFVGMGIVMGALSAIVLGHGRRPPVLVE